MERIFLNEKKTLVCAVAAWLSAQIRTTPGGAPSLSHLLVVVPTRQAGRRLRQALAEQAGGCLLPPLVRLPAQLIVPAHEPALPVATPAETLGLLAGFAFGLDLSEWPDLFPEKGRPRQRTFAWALGVARQIGDLWTILQENALTMADVSNRIEDLLSGENLDVEIARWHDLARLEARFFDALRAAGRTPAPLARQAAAADPALPDGIEGIVLPALSDAQPALYPVLEKLAARTALSVLIHADASDDARFDVWGRPDPARWTGDQAPRLTLADDQIVLAANAAEQAKLVAGAFAAIPGDREPPALGLADEALFSELQSAFLSRGLRLHSPAAYPLAASSLGRLIGQLEALRSEPRFATLAAFLREADVLRWLESRCGADASLLRALDDLQNKHLPQTLDDALRFCQPASDDSGARALAQALDAVRGLLDPQGQPHLDHLTAMLRTLFASRTLSEQAAGDRELAAAAAATFDVIEALASDALTGALDDAQRSQLFETLLASATYPLEPEAPDALLTEGWLELPWNPSRELLIAGFNEGSVPDAVVGHAFLPDRLRQGLGLTSNEQRTARDTFLLCELLASRPPHAVRLFLERVSERNDVRKPSRLLFLCDEATLAARAKKLFGETETAAHSHPHALPAAWRLSLPIPDAPPAALSVTAFKSYLECPFTFFLRHRLGMEPCTDRAKELDAAAFGTLCHSALEAFGRSPLKDETDAETITAFLCENIDRTLRTQYGEPLPAILRLQAAAVRKRLSFFAAQQARLRAEGWRIADIERPLKMVEHGLTVSGRADRIDRNETSGAWRVIDYKTWDRLGTNGGLEHVFSSSKAVQAFARERGFEPFTFEKKTRVWADLQLPLYLLMARLDALIPADAPVTCGYFVLGETEAETVCQTWSFDNLRDEAAAAADRVIDGVRAGLFWPPSPQAVWARDYASLFLEGPENEVGTAWIADQQARRSKGGAPCAS